MIMLLLRRMSEAKCDVSEAASLLMQRFVLLSGRQTKYRLRSCLDLNSTFCSWQHRFRDSRIILNSRSRLQNKSGRVDADSRGNENRGSNVRLRIPRSKLANVDTDHRKLLRVIAMYRYE